MIWQRSQHLGRDGRAFPLAEPVQHRQRLFRQRRPATFSSVRLELGVASRPEHPRNAQGRVQIGLVRSDRCSRAASLEGAQKASSSGRFSAGIAVRRRAVEGQT